jgi:hypothetical protein
MSDDANRSIRTRAIDERLLIGGGGQEFLERHRNAPLMFGRCLNSDRGRLTTCSCIAWQYFSSNPTAI